MNTKQLQIKYQRWCDTVYFLCEALNEIEAYEQLGIEKQNPEVMEALNNWVQRAKDAELIERHKIGLP